MKHIITSFLLLAAFISNAQEIDRTKAPQPLPPPVINIPDAANFTLANGLKVFVVRNTKLPKVSATLTIDKIAIAEGSKAGVGNLMGSLLRYGTTKADKVKLDEDIDFLGGAVQSSALSVYGSSLSSNFPKLFSLMADVALRPSFLPGNLEKIRKQTLSGLEAAKDEPQSISSNVANVLLYGKNHPYGEIETEKSVKSVTLADVKKFYTTYWKPNAAYLVFVGDITVEDARKLATQYFGAWPKGVVTAQTFPAVKAPAKTYIAIVDRPSSVQSVIDVTTPVDLKPGTPDAIPASVMNTVLGGGFSSRLVQNLREKHGFTYSAGSSLSANRLVGRFSASASVRNEKTDSAVAEFLSEIKRLKEERAPDEEVSSLKNYMSGGFARSLETPATIADFALNIARYGLPKDYYRNYLTNLSAVTPEKVQEEANKFLSSGLIITIVGNAKEIAPGLEKYGEVKYFDIYGNPVPAPVFKKADVSITGEDILKKAISAYGGNAAIDAVKDLTITGKMTIMGQELDYVQKVIVPTGFLMQVQMQGMTAIQQRKKGSEYSVSQMGQEAPITDDVKAEMDAQAYFISENALLSQSGNTYTVKGIEQVNGKDAYVLAIITAKGAETTSLYDVASGLKLADIREADAGPMGKIKVTVSYLDYKEFNGVKIPVKFVIDQGQMKPEVSITDVKINTGLKEADL
jgi:zinc protease